MKIVSRFKDFYDYLQGVYGVDPLKVLDRTKWPVNTYASSQNVLILYFCGQVYIRYYAGSGLSDKKTFNEAVEKLEKVRPWKWSFADQTWLYHKKKTIVYLDDQYCWAKWDEPPTLTLDFPYGLVLEGQLWETTPQNVGSMVVLADIGFHKVMTAEDCYRQIEAFISKKEVDTPQSPTDMNRLEAKGFSKKTSFRH